MKTFIPPQLKGNIKPRDISHIRVSVNTHTRVLEKPLYFDPFGQTVFAHFGHKMIDPCKVLVQGSKLGALSSL